MGAGSIFRAYEQFQIPLGASTKQTIETFRDAFLARQWRILTDTTKMIIKATGLAGTWTGSVASVFDEDGYTTVTGSVGAGQGMWATFENAVTVKKVAITYGPNTGPNYRATQIIVDYSDDSGTPTTWTPLQTFSTPYIGDLVTILTLTTTASHKHWRVRFITAPSSISVSGIAFYDDLGNRSIVEGQCLIDVIPPASETIGNEVAFDAVRLRSTGTMLYFSSKYYLASNINQSFALRGSTAGSTQYQLTIGSTTVVQAPASMSAGNSANDNLYHLFKAVKASAAADFTDWSFEWIAPAAMNGLEGAVIRATRKTYSDAKIVVATGENATLIELAEPYPAGTSNDLFYHYEQDSSTFANGSKFECSIDLISGFIYFLGICKRSFTLGAKTNAGYSGPVTCEWIDNAIAKSVLPVPSGPYASPVELFIIGTGKAYRGQSPSAITYYRPGHMLCLSDINKKRSEYDVYYGTMVFPIGKFKTRGILYDSTPLTSFAPTSQTSDMAASGIWKGDVSSSDVGNDWQIHRVTLPSVVSGTSGDQYGGGASTWIIPAAPLEGHFSVAGTIVDEQLLIVADTTVQTTLVTPMDETTDYTDIVLTSTSGMPTKGTIVIDAVGLLEAVDYNGIVGNTLKNCVRARYASKKWAHSAGDQIRMGLWFVKINNAAILCGFVAPNV